MLKKKGGGGKNETKVPENGRRADGFHRQRGKGRSVEINSKVNLSFSSSWKNLEKIGDSDFEGATIDGGGRGENGEARWKPETLYRISD